MVKGVKFDVPDFGKVLTETVAQTKVQAAFGVRQEAQKRVPVDTGTLLRSIAIEKQDKDFFIVAREIYAAIIEYGFVGKQTVTNSNGTTFEKNVNRPANPFMRVSAIVIQEKVPQVFYKNLDKNIRRYRKK